jgi:hypothetical protein
MNVAHAVVGNGYYRLARGFVGALIDNDELEVRERVGKHAGNSALRFLRAITRADEHGQGRIP